MTKHFKANAIFNPLIRALLDDDPQLDLRWLGEEYPEFEIEAIDALRVQTENSHFGLIAQND